MVCSAPRRPGPRPWSVRRRRLLGLVLVLILGLLGASGFSVYHGVPRNIARTTPDSAADDSQLGHITNTSSFVYDAEAEHYQCEIGTNQTDCLLQNTGLCGRSNLILSTSFVDGYVKVHSLIYPFCLLAVVVLYSLIYRAVLVRRARRMKMRGSAVALARRMTPTTDLRQLNNPSATGTTRLLQLVAQNE